MASTILRRLTAAVNGIRKVPTGVKRETNSLGQAAQEVVFRGMMTSFQVSGGPDSKIAIHLKKKDILQKSTSLSCFERNAGRASLLLGIILSNGIRGTEGEKT